MTEHRTPDDEARLVQLLRGDLPPARDPLFRIDVLARLERRRFRRQLAVALSFGAVSGLRNLVSPLLARVTQTVSRAFVD
jgi:hypothetical protein